MIPDRPQKKIQRRPKPSGFAMSPGKIGRRIVEIQAAPWTKETAEEMQRLYALLPGVQPRGTNRPNQRQQRKARRRAWAAGDRHAFHR